MSDSELEIDSIISRLLETLNPSTSNQKNLTEQEIQILCLKSSEILLSQPTLVDLNPPLKVVGKLSGQFHDLLRIFETEGYPPHSTYLFLGNYD